MRTMGKTEAMTVIGSFGSTRRISMPAMLSSNPYAADGVMKSAVGRKLPAVKYRKAAKGAATYRDNMATQSWGKLVPQQVPIGAGDSCRG